MFSSLYAWSNLQGEIYVYYNLHRATKHIPLGPSPLGAGVHEYPFTFMVPRNLPPSLRASQGAVHHRLRASLKRQGHVPSLLLKMAGVQGSTKIPLVVHNSDHISPLEDRPSSPDEPPAYSTNRRQWSGQKRNGQIDWLLQGPASAHISHRVDILAKLRIAKGVGVVNSVTVDLVQVEKYQAQPDRNVWTFPVEQVNDDGEFGSGSEDGYPEIRTSGVNLKEAITLSSIAGGLKSHCREKVLILSDLCLILAFYAYQSYDEDISASSRC